MFYIRWMNRFQNPSITTKWNRFSFDLSIMPPITKYFTCSQTQWLITCSYGKSRDHSPLFQTRWLSAVKLWLQNGRVWLLPRTGLHFQLHQLLPAFRTWRQQVLQVLWLGRGEMENLKKSVCDTSETTTKTKTYILWRVRNFKAILESFMESTI